MAGDDRWEAHRRGEWYHSVCAGATGGIGREWHRTTTRLPRKGSTDDGRVASGRPETAGRATRSDLLFGTGRIPGWSLRIAAMRSGVLRRKRLAGWAAAAVAALLASGPASAIAGTVRVSGTGAAVTTFRLLGEAFRKVRPDIDIVVLPGMGSSGGIKAATVGKLDIGLVARPLRDGERAGDIVARVYAQTPFVFAANESVRVDGLALSEVVDIYAGRKNRWKDGKRIRLVLRPLTDTDNVMLKSISPQMNEAVTAALRREGMMVGLNDQDAADAIERTPGGFGAVSLSLVLSEKRAVRVLALDGVVPGVRTMKDGSYAYFKTFYLVTKRTPSPATREFLEFVRSPAGAALLLKNGQVAVR